MLSWDALNFILVIYSNAPQLTYSLIILLAMARMVIRIRSVCPSVQKFSWNWLFSFFRELNMVLGALLVLCMKEPDFLKKMFFECIYRKVQVFFLVLYFFISVVYNESLYYCNSCMLEQISYLEKFWFLRYGPKHSWPFRLRIFQSITGISNWLYFTKKLMK